MIDVRNSEVLQRTLDLMILKTLHTLGRFMVYDCTSIEQVSCDILQLNEEPCTPHCYDCNIRDRLLRVRNLGEQSKAKFYSITKRGTSSLPSRLKIENVFPRHLARVLQLEGKES